MSTATAYRGEIRPSCCIVAALASSPPGHVAEPQLGRPLPPPLPQIEIPYPIKMKAPRVAICSLFRDSKSYLSNWLSRRLSLHYPQDSLCHVCIEGDSTDGTYERLQRIQHKLPNLVLRKLDTNQPRFGSVVHPLRFANLSNIANFALELALQWTPNFILWLESDLVYEPDLLQRLLVVDGDVVAPMVLREGTDLFYDTWAFRRARAPESQPGQSADEGRFQTRPPYHEDLDPRRPLRLDSAGSVLLAKAEVVERGARLTADEAIVGFCREARALGFEILLDPSTSVYHPKVRTPRTKTLRKRLPLLRQRLAPRKWRRKSPPWELKTIGRFQSQPPIDNKAYRLGKRMGYARPLEYAWAAQRLLRHDALTLDFGSGKSEFPAYLASWGLPVVSVDFQNLGETHKRHQARRGVCYSFVQGDGRQLPFPAATFDQCVAISSVEHERNDRSLMAELSRVCRPGARIVLTVPYDHFCFWWDGDRPDGGQYYYDYSTALKRLVYSISATLLDFTFVRYHLPVERLAPYFTHPSNGGVLMMELRNGR